MGSERPESIIAARGTRLSMRINLTDRQWAGFFLFSGIGQFAIFLTVAEAIDPTYSVSTNYISDLGVSAAAPVFNTAIILVGLAVLTTSWFLFRTFHDRILMILVALAGIGAVGVGVFTEYSPDGLHSLFSLITFLFSALAAIYGFRVIRPPLQYISVLLGIFSLAALGLYVSGTYLGLGPGVRQPAGIQSALGSPKVFWS